jgi:lysozyme family protein
MDEAFRKEGRRSFMKFKEGMVRRVERAKARRDAWRREEVVRRKHAAVAAAAAAGGDDTTSMGKSGSGASRTQE